MRLKLNFLWFILITAINSAFSQELDSISMSVENDVVVVKFDFVDGEPEEVYELYLYSSHDNFQKPLQLTAGDVGKGIKVGVGKTIYWNAKEELGNFKGDLSLKIKGDKYVPIVQYQNIHERLKTKRGEPFEIHWAASDKTEKVALKILRNGVPVMTPEIVENTGTFTWMIPMNAKAGKGYTVQISDTDNLLREETSAVFSVTRKLPLVFKILPAVAVAGGIAAILMTREDPENGIPEPPLTPNAN
jgi:hypothetical protein